MTNTAKMPRKELSLAEKITLLDKVKTLPRNTTNRQLSELTGIPKSTVARIIQHEKRIREEWKLCGGQQRKKRKREGKDPEVEEALTQWYGFISKQNVKVSGPMLKTVAEDIAKNLGRSDFRATDGWLSRWKSRRDIKFKQINTEIEDNTDINEFANVAKLFKIFGPDDIYNIEETALLYRVTPDGSLNFNTPITESDRLTIFCCTNMSGTDKQKLLAIGKTVNPQCFKGLNRNSLPCEYYSNNNAFITAEIFTKFLTNWDEILEQSSRKVLVLLSSCSVHPQLDLKNIHLEFLPPNLVQPMNMGIVQNLKTLYRVRLVHYIKELIEDNLLTNLSTPKEASEQINLLKAMQLLADSWREIETTTIQNSFIQSGFTHSSLEIPVITENQALLELQQVTNYEEFTSIDNNLQCYGGTQDTKETEEITIKQELEETDDNKVENITEKDARKYINGLRRYFMQLGNEDSPLSALDSCADFVYHQSKIS